MQTPPLRLTADDAKDGDWFGRSVSVFEDWAIFGAPFSDEGRAYLYRRVLGEWNHHPTVRANDWSEGDEFGFSVSIYDKTMIVGAPNKDNGGAVYVFTLQGETWTEDKKLTASDGVSGDKFGWSVAIRGDTVIVGAFEKDGGKGAVYAFVLAGDGSWDEGMRLIPRNGIVSKELFGSAVALSGDRALIGAHGSEEKGRDSGVAYIFQRVNGEWKEEAKLVPVDGNCGYYFGLDVALSGDTAIIGSPFGSYSGSVYVFVRQDSGTRDDGTWEEVQTLTPANGKAGDWFGYSVAISGDTAVIGAVYDDEMGSNSGSGYVYTKIGRKWTENVKIVPEGGANYDNFGTSVAISGSTALFGAPYVGEGNRGSAYVVDLCVP